MKLNRVKMFARRISATERLVRSPPAFASPRERRSATWALLRPADGVSATGAAGAGGVEAAASAMPGHRVAVQRPAESAARPGPGYRAALAAPHPRTPRITLPQTPSVHLASAPILNGLGFAAAILLFPSEASADPASTALERRVEGPRRHHPAPRAMAVRADRLPKITSVVSRSSSPAARPGA